MPCDAVEQLAEVFSRLDVVEGCSRRHVLEDDLDLSTWVDGERPRRSTAGAGHQEAGRLVADAEVEFTSKVGPRSEQFQRGR